jgi:hypothetical protein
LFPCDYTTWLYALSNKVWVVQTQIKFISTSSAILFSNIKSDCLVAQLAPGEIEN